MEKKRSILRSPGILLVALVVMVAATGLVYAHWTTTLQTEANVQTGQVTIEWFGAFTNDDGAWNGDSEPTTTEVYDHWGLDSSRDPSTAVFNGDRYDKDVAKCTAVSDGNLQINIENGYPSYNCTIHGTVGAPNGIPVRATNTLMGYAGGWVNGFWTDTDTPEYYTGPVGQDEEGTFFADENNDGVWDDGEPSLSWTNNEAAMAFEPVGGGSSAYALSLNGVQMIEGDFGVACGTQVDPIPCNWYDNEDGTGNAFYGNVDWCNLFNGDERQCKYNEDGSLVGEYNQIPDPEWVEPDPPDGSQAPFIDGDFIPGTETVMYYVCDEGGTVEVDAGWIHILQEAAQNSSYNWTLEQNFVNWNEFSYCMCDEGVEAVTADGLTVLGTVVEGYTEGAIDCVLPTVPGDTGDPDPGAPPVGG